MTGSSSTRWTQQTQKVTLGMTQEVTQEVSWEVIQEVTQVAWEVPRANFHGSQVTCWVTSWDNHICVLRLAEARRSFLRNKGSRLR